MRRSPEDIAALGFSPHTGWAAAVAVTPEWEIIERRRIVYEPEAARFIYHHAAEIPRDEAAAVIATARAQATNKAQEQIRALISALSRKGKPVFDVCAPGGNVRLPTSLPDILSVHARIHAAEGVFYRDVLADGCAQNGLAVRRVPERDLWAVASKALACHEDKLRERLAKLGKQLGPPWGEDQKRATLAALIALNSGMIKAQV